MTTVYQVTVQMNCTTIAQLMASGHILWGLQPVQCADKTALPAVCFGTQSYATSTVISWTENLQAYTSTTPIVPSSVVQAGFSTAIQTGQVVTVTAGGVGTVGSGGISEAVSFVNTVSVPFTCGISVVFNQTPAPLCAAPLYGNNIQVFSSVTSMFLMFSNRPLTTGTMMDLSLGPGVLIDLSSSNQRTVSYDIETGWSWGDFTWATSYPPLSNLQEILIQEPSSALLASTGKLRRQLIL